MSDFGDSSEKFLGTGAAPNGATSISYGLVSKQYVLLRLTMLTTMNGEIFQTICLCQK